MGALLTSGGTSVASLVDRIQHIHFRKDAKSVKEALQLIKANKDIEHAKATPSRAYTEGLEEAS